jgi:hypothetical protein
MKMNKWLFSYFYGIYTFFFIFIFSAFPSNAACPSFSIKIMPLGDSITWGYTDGKLTNETTVGYRQKLYLDLTNLGYNIDFVGSLISGESVSPPFDCDHEGWGGIRAYQVADEIYEWLDANPPDIVLLHIGTNGIQNPTDVERILNEIDRFSLDIIVILARIINRKEYHEDTTIFNDDVENMARNRIAMGDKILIVDQESALNYPDDMADLKHPKQRGYDKMADVWLDELLTILPLCEDAIGTFRKGAWYLDSNGNDQWDGNADATHLFGIPTDKPVTGDWNGDGITNIGVFRDGAWYLDFNGNGSWDPGVDKKFSVHSFGNPNDIPVTGDWNGDGKTNIGVFRKGSWYLDFNGNGKWDPGVDIAIPVHSFGNPNDIPITGDWNGDGITNIGVFRNGEWYLDFNGNAKWDPGVDKAIPIHSLGNPNDIPITGDWNGDGITNIGVFRNGEWYLDYSGNDKWDSDLDITIFSGSFGTPSDVPIIGRWKKNLL